MEQTVRQYFQWNTCLTCVHFLFNFQAYDEWLKQFKEQASEVLQQKSTATESVSIPK